MRAPRIGVVLGLLSLALVPMASAHNPALTIHAPAQLDGGLVVLGEEGVGALLELDGTVRWRIDELGHLPSAPIASGAQAIALSMEPGTGNASVIALGGDGEGWRAPLPTVGRAHLVERAGAIWAFGVDGVTTVLDGDGDLLRTLPSPEGIAVAPVNAPGSGWWIATEDGGLFRFGADHAVVRGTTVVGRPTDLAADERHVYVSVRGGDGPTRLEVFDHDLLPVWAFPLQEASRIGGRVGQLRGGPVFGTYSGGGAEVVHLTFEGELVWRTPVPNATAAAVTVEDDRVFVTSNDGVLALDADGNVLWEASADPFVAGPHVHDGLVLVPGAANELLALNATDGRVAWSYDDGVEQAPWTEHDRPPPVASEPAAETPIGTLPVLLVTVLAAVLRRNARRGCVRQWTGAASTID